MDDTDTTTDPDRMPTWNEMRDLVRAGTDPDLPVRPPEPAGSSLNRARVQRWARGDYDDQLARERPIAQPAPPPPKPRPRVTVKGTERLTRTTSTGPDAERRAGLELAARLRDAGVTSARWAREPHGSWGLRVDPGDERRAAAVLDAIAGGERQRG